MDANEAMHVADRDKIMNASADEHCDSVNPRLAR